MQQQRSAPAFLSSAFPPPPAAAPDLERRGHRPAFALVQIYGVQVPIANIVSYPNPMPPSNRSNMIFFPPRILLFSYPHSKPSIRSRPAHLLNHRMHPFGASSQLPCFSNPFYARARTRHKTSPHPSGIKRSRVPGARRPERNKCKVTRGNGGLLCWGVEFTRPHRMCGVVGTCRGKRARYHGATRQRARMLGVQEIQ